MVVILSCNFMHEGSILGNWRIYAWILQKRIDIKLAMHQLFTMGTKIGFFYLHSPPIKRQPRRPKTKGTGWLQKLWKIRHNWGRKNLESSAADATWMDTTKLLANNKFQLHKKQLILHQVREEKVREHQLRLNQVNQQQVN